MKIKTHLMAFEDDKIREVEIPDDTPKDEILDAVFKWGQNDFQPLPMPSLSVGDVIELEPNKYEIILPVGFASLDSKTFEQYKNVPTERRSMFAYSLM